MDNQPKEGIRNSLRVWEYFALAGGFILLWALLTKYALGGPISSDIAWYYHVGADNLKETFVLNRYFHIFLQKFFVGTQSEPMPGLQFYWSFLFASTTVILYLVARLLSPTSNLWNGILAVILFFSLPAVREVSGVPYVDVTAMMMLSALLLVYVLSANVNHQKKLLLILFGCLLFLGFKTKETVLPGAILVLGFCIQDRQIAWRLGGKRILWILVGILFGLALLILLNSLILHDAFFGLRPVDITSYLGSYFKGTSLAPDPGTTQNWIDGFFLPFAFLPLLLYVMSGIKVSQKLDFDRQVIWLLPLVFILLLIVSINNKWDYQTRFALPVLPILCVLGAQVIKIPNSLSRQEKLGLIFCGIVLIGLSVVLLRIPRAVFYLIISPLIFLALLYVISIVKNDRHNALLLLSLLILISLVPIHENAYEMVREQPNRQTFLKTVLPFTSFADQLRFTPDTQLLFDARINSTIPLKILKTEDEIFTTYNIALNANTNRKNFKLADTLDEITKGIVSGEYTYFLLAVETWFQLEKDPLLTALLASNYAHLASPDNNYILLISNAAIGRH